MGYIANEVKQFHIFVANRVAAIHEVTSPPQWKHVDTKQNLADNASRGLSAEALLKDTRRIRGPDFLWKSEDAWPSQQCSVSIVAENDFSTYVEAGSTFGQLFGRFSKWQKFVAWILRYQDNLRRAVKRHESGPMPSTRQQE